ncbi:MAG: hypothetical protein WHS82_01035 [Candidatus Methanosuratincola sp.]
MRPSRVATVLKILVLSQIRVRGRRSKGILSRPRGILLLSVLAFFASAALVYYPLSFIPASEASFLGFISLQLLYSVPLIALAFVVLYGVFFLIGENAQYSSSEMINFMPVSSAEYVLASSLSTVISYGYIVAALLGVSLALALKFSLLGAWALSSALSIFSAILGGFVSEIIKAAVNRLSSSFSKRSGRTAIFSRAVLIVLVLLLSQFLFNPGILFRVLEALVPRFQDFWFVPLLWPSIVVVEASMGNFVRAALFAGITALFGGAVMAAGVMVRTKYWVPVPVTIKLGRSGSGGSTSIPGSGFGRQLFTQVELALLSKDLRSLTRRKEMVRFWAIPFIIMIPILLSGGSMNRYEAYAYSGMISMMGTGMFGLFLSAMSVGQEGRAIWNIFASPVDPESYFKSKVLLPISLSLILALVYWLVFSIAFSLGSNAATTLLVLNFEVACISVGVGLYFGSKYPELSEKPRSSYITGTGMLLAFFVFGVSVLISASPVLQYFFVGSALAIYLELALSLLLGLAISALFYWLARKQFRRLFYEIPL